jgi:hypothetical protein
MRRRAGVESAYGSEGLDRRQLQARNATKMLAVERKQFGIVHQCCGCDLEIRKTDLLGLQLRTELRRALGVRFVEVYHISDVSNDRQKSGPPGGAFLFPGVDPEVELLPCGGRKAHRLITAFLQPGKQIKLAFLPSDKSVSINVGAHGSCADAPSECRRQSGVIKSG